MAEQQLVDYIKKAKAAGQTDEQSRATLAKNGWTDAEIGEAFAALTPSAQPQAQPQPEPQPQTVNQPQPVVTQPKIAVQPQPQITQVKPVSIPPQENPPNMKGQSHFLMKFLIVFVIVIVLCGAGYFAAGQYLNLPFSNVITNLFAPNPKTVMTNMAAAMKNVKSFHSETQGNISAVDNKNVTQGNLAFSVKGGGGANTFTFNLTAGGATLASANINTIVSGQTFYFIVNDITLPTGVSYPGLDISKIKGNWFSSDQKSFEEMSQVDGGMGTINIPQGGDTELSKKIQELILSENLISVTKQLNDQAISGQETYHYLAVISKDKIKDLLTKINSSAGSFAETIGDINVELWIGKKDFLLYQYKIDKAVDFNKIFPGANMQANLKLASTNSDFNKPITVTIPASAQKIEDFALPLLKISQINSDINQIKTIGQYLFLTDKNYSLLCSRGLLNGYLKDSGPTLVNLNNDIVAQGGGKPACFASATRYCISTRLPDGTYLCANENDIKMGTIKCASWATNCR